MASAIFADLAKRFSLEGIDIDTWVFKFYSRATVGIFMVAVAASVADAYGGGKTIECEGASSYETNYCWLTGVQHLKPGDITKNIHNNHDCFDVDDVGDERMSNYYLWVSLVLFLCGAVFIIPNEIWKHMEGGLLKQFGTDQSDFLKEENGKNAAKRFKEITNNHANRYFFTFLTFEVVYFILGIVVFNLLDVFIGGKFITYGLDTISYLKGETAPVEITDDGKTYELTVNPMCNAFPTIVSCSISKFAVVKDIADTKNVICILGQNIMNQKIFLVLWVWFVILFSVSACQVIYRITTIFVPGFQATMIQQHLRSSDKKAVEKLRLGPNNIGNWFLITQIGNNSDPYAFRMFLDHVAGIKRKDDNESIAKQKPKKKKTKNDDNDIAMIEIAENGNEKQDLEKGEKEKF